MTERELFLSALEIEDPEARRAHVEAACGDDSERLHAIELLLASHDGESRFLRSPALQQLGGLLADGSEATLAYDCTHDDGDATATHSNERNLATDRLDDPSDEIPLGYLEPSTRVDSLGRLAHYEILEVIGRGAFGIVLRAFDEKLHRVVAIKVLSPEMAATSPARKRFLREARSSAAVRHDNVVAIHAVEDQPIPYLVMDYIPGQTLQQRLDEHGPLDLSAVLRLGRQIAEGLAAAHARDLIHRDVKPGNILLETGIEDRVKITDFGLARTADDASMTQSGTIAGTPMYMAPEQALGRKLDRRADLFSLGSVLYQMLSGRPPFRAPSTLAVLKRVTEEAPRPMREIIPEVPAWMCELVGHLHAKDPDRRYGSAKEVADLLGRCLADVQQGRTPIVPVPVSPVDERTRAVATTAPASPPRRLVRRLIAGAAAVLLLLVGLGITEATGVTALGSTVVRLALGSGTLVVESDDPGVTIAIDGGKVTIRGGGIEELTLRPGEYEIAAVKDGRAVKQELVTITRNGRTVVRMTLEPTGKADTPTTERPAAPVAEAEWVALFNGRNLTGWSTRITAPEHWVVEDGILVGSQRPSVLYSERSDYANFHLRVEAKINPGGDSGIFFRTAVEEPPRNQAQVGITSGFEVEIHENPTYTSRKTGSITAPQPRSAPIILGLVTDDSLARPDEWFTLEIVAEQNRLITKLNGREVANWRDQLGKVAAGPIGLQVWSPNTVVQFRKIEIREVPASEPSSIPGPPRHFAADEWIDVIPLIDPKLDRWDMRLTGRNEWRIENGELVVGDADDRLHKLLLPLDGDFAPSFECELDVTRRAGDGGFNFNFPTPNGDTPVHFDHPTKQGVTLRPGPEKLEPIAEGAQIETGKRTTFRVEVRHLPAGDRVSVWKDGTEVGTLTGDRNQFASLNNEGYPHRRRLSLFLGGGTFVFHRIRVRMLDGGTVDSVRPVPVNDGSPSPVDALPPAAPGGGEIEIE